MQNDKTIYIEIFQPEHQPAALELWKNTPGMGLSESDNYEYIRCYLERNPGLSFVVMDGVRLIGTVLCGHDGRRGFIYHLTIAPEYRGRGLGRELVSRCLAGLRQAGIERCSLCVFKTNIEGIQFWEKMQFVKRDMLHMMSIHLLTDNNDNKLPQHGAKT